MKIYDVLRKREEKSEEKKENKVRWDNVGVLVDKEGKLSIKLNVVPIGDWDGWLTVKERQEKPAADAKS